MFLIEGIMTREVVTVKPDSSIQNISRKMAQNNISCVIVAKGKTPVGIISERDFVKKILSRSKDAEKLTAKDVMSSPVYSVTSKDTIINTSRLMRAKNVRHFAVVEDSMLKGIVTETDLVKGERDYIKAHQILQNLVLTLFMTLTLIFFLVFIA
ncbi:MAG: cyclic nucleotide-binding/CBS domain-containing protein [Candidatus Woesearchaeota archaeon]